MINSSAVREELQNELSTFINNLSDHRQETICGSYSAEKIGCLIGVHLQESPFYCYSQVAETVHSLQGPRDDSPCITNRG